MPPLTGHHQLSAISRLAEAAAKRLNDLLGGITKVIREIGGIGDVTEQINKRHAMQVVALAAQTGKALKTEFNEAMRVLADIDPNDYANRVELDRSKAQTQLLLASARDNVTTVSDSEPTMSREQREVNNQMQTLAVQNNSHARRLYELMRELVILQQETVELQKEGAATA